MRRQDLDGLQLPASVDLDAFVAECNVAIEAYLEGTGIAEARQWRRVQKLLRHDAVLALEGILPLLPSNPDAPQARLIADLKETREQANRRVQYFGPISEKSQLFVRTMWAWTDAGGLLGASEHGPLQRVLCYVAERVNQELVRRNRGGDSVPQTKFVKLGPRGAKDVIDRERERRKTLTELRMKGKLGADALVDSFGRRR
jgi:hypothetical protein